MAPTPLGASSNEVRPHDFRSSCAARTLRSRSFQCSVRRRRVWRQQQPERRRRASASGGADFTKQGDIEYWQGKDTSRAAAAEDDRRVQRPAPQRQGHPARAARQCRPAAAADDPEHPDQEPEDGRDQHRRRLDRRSSPPTATSRPRRTAPSTPTGFLKAAVDAATYFSKLYVDPEHLRRRPAVLPHRPAQEVRHRQAADHLRRDEGRLRRRSWRARRTRSSTASPASTTSTRA